MSCGRRPILRLTEALGYRKVNLAGLNLLQFASSSPGARMNAPIILAQANPSPTAPRVIRLEKPAADAAVTLRVDGVTRLDLGAIAAEQITLVRIGDTLVILFDNKATVTLEPFFAADGT